MLTQFLPSIFNVQVLLRSYWFYLWSGSYDHPISSKDVWLYC